MIVDSIKQLIHRIKTWYYRRKEKNRKKTYES